MEFYQLEAFVMVAAHRSFSRAAEQLYLSQPTISSHVKSLETELNTPLFDRGKNGLLLTPAGTTLFRYAKDLLQLRTDALTELGAGVIQEEKLIVAASSVPCQYLLPKAIVDFQQLYPQVKVTLRQENSRKASEDVFHYHYALGIVGEQLSIPHLVYEPLVSDQLVVAIPQQAAYEELLMKETLTMADLLNYNLLLREAGSGTRSLFTRELQCNGMDLADLQLQIFDNQETIKQAVRHGLGVTIISRYVVEDYLQFGLVATRHLQDLQLTRDFYLVAHAKRILTPAAIAFRDFVLSFFQRGPEKDERNIC
ncbi:MAG TPA: selenium metabolism-associated LysR family transcriptional regulator [Oscillospiraceae bacterium]|nr:selenium metabolism-associated LysR family transcriptional regulator [Oscillospiraceae bacterium]